MARREHRVLVVAPADFIREQGPVVADDLDRSAHDRLTRVVGVWNQGPGQSFFQDRRFLAVGERTVLRGSRCRKSKKRDQGEESEVSQELVAGYHESSGRISPAR